MDIVLFLVSEFHVEREISMLVTKPKDSSPARALGAPNWRGVGEALLVHRWHNNKN